MLASLSSRVIAFIVIGLSCLVALVWYLTAYQSAQTTIASLTTEIDALESKRQIGENAKRNVQRLCGVVAGLEADKAGFLAQLPSSEQFSSLLTNLRTGIETNKGQLNSLTRQLNPASGAAPIPAGIRAVNLSMALEGTYGSLYSILVSLEQQQRFLNVENVSFSQGNQATIAGDRPSSNPNLSSALSLTAYVYDDPARSTQTTTNPICAEVTPVTTPTTPVTTPVTPASTGSGEVPR